MLEKKGFEISPILPLPRPTGRMTGAGEIARKGRTSIVVDASAQSLVITDVTIKSALECFDEIVKMLIEDCNIDITKNVRFYTFVAAYEIPANKKSYETIAKALRFSIYDNIEEIISEKVWAI